MNLTTATQNFGLGSDSRPMGEIIKQRFLGEKRNLQLAVKAVSDAMATTSDDPDFAGMIEIAHAFGVTQETFRPLVIEAAKLLQGKDAAWYAANAHGDSGAWTPGGVTRLYRGEYLLLAAMIEAA